MNNIYYTNISYDGFGSQYQKIIQTYIYCKMNSLPFAYTPLKDVEHNYNNDQEYNNKLENVMNLKNNITNCNDTMTVDTIDYIKTVIPYFEENINNCCQSEDMKFIKKCFWENKDKNFFNNNKINIAVHIRRENSHDKGQAGERATTPNSYYLEIMNKIREKYKDNDKKVLFHIYSQGVITKFIDLANSDVKFYLDYDICESFTGMVSAEILVTSPSSLSYIAALISDGEIYYKKFWHNPRKNWIKYE